MAAMFQVTQSAAGRWGFAGWLAILMLGAGIVRGAAQTGTRTASRVPSVVASHPRVWLTADRLNRLRRYAAANTARWQKVKADADAALGYSSSQLGDYWNTKYIPLLGLAYQVTRNSTYARKAIQAMLLHAVPSNTLTRDSYYDYRWAIPDITAGYDWCYDQMSAAERAQVAGWLMDRADAVWPETNPNRVGGWAVADPANNYFYGFLTTWPAALAVYGDEPRAGFHIDLGVAKFQTLARQYTDGTGRGGLWHESTNYDSTHMLALILDAHWTATGEDLAADPSFVFLRESLLWRLHSTAPDLSHYYNWGDQSRYAEGLLYFVDRQRALFAAARVNDSTLRGYAKYWLDTIASGPFSFNQSAWEFLFYDEDVVATNYAGITPYYFAPGAGILLRRSSWQSDATYWGIWAGPLDQSHQYKDVNGFLIWKGGWLVSNANMWGDSGIWNTTPNHNNYTFGGLEQTWQYPNATWPDPAGKVLKQENTAEYSYFAGWGAQAYVQEPWRGGTKIANDYVRKLVYIDPTTFLIYDRVNLVNAGTRKELHLHSKKAITVNGRNYTWDNGSYRLFGSSLLPETGVSLNTVSLGTSYRLDIVTANNRQTDHILNVFQVRPVSQTSAPQPEIVRNSAGNMEGAKVGNWVVLFGKSELISTNVTYDFSATATTQHLVVDLRPNTAYQVTTTELSTNASTTTNATTSSLGSLRFSVPAGSYRVTLAPGGQDTTPPATPTGLAATAGDGSVSLRWNPNSEPDLAGYNVYRSTSATGSYTRVVSTPLTGTVALVTGLQNGTTYYFRVSAVDTSGNESALSAAVSATPAGSTLTYSISGRVTLNGSGLSGVTVSAGSATATTAADGTYRIAGLAAGTYTVSASRTGYSFSAPQTVTVGPDRTGVDFTATVVSSGDETFVRGINLGGGAVTIEGNAWLSHAAALASGFSVTGGSTDPTYPFTPNPPVDADTDAMLHTNVWGSSSFTLSQGVENGSYRIYLWVAEDGADNARDMVVRVEGVTVASGIGELPLGGWRKYGPYSAEVGDGSLTVEVARGTKGSPQVMGLAIFRAAAAPTTYSISGRVTLNGSGLSGVTVSAGSATATTAADGTYRIAGLAAGTYTVSASRTGYSFSAPQTVTVGPDRTGVDFTATPTAASTPPGAPTNLTATAVSGTQVRLTWRDNADNETSQRLEQKVGAGNFQEVKILAANVTTYTLGGLTPGTTYTFRVRARNAAGFSSYSNEAAATTPTPPAAPSDLTAAAVTGSQVRLSWRDNSDNETSFRVEAKIGTAVFADVQGTPADTTACTVTGLLPGTIYTFRVKARGPGGDSDYSNEATVTTLDPPAAPSDLTATALSSTQILLTWRDNADNETSFRLERKTGSSEFDTVKILPANATSTRDTGLTPGTTYVYRICARNLGGESACSNEATAATRRAAIPTVGARLARNGEATEFRRVAPLAGAGPERRRAGEVPLPWAGARPMEPRALRVPHRRAPLRA